MPIQAVYNMSELPEHSFLCVPGPETLQVKHWPNVFKLDTLHTLDQS